MLDLHAYLAMPVQQIPRYVLLLQELVNTTPIFSPDYGPLLDVLNKMRAVAEDINERKREAERREELLLVNRQLTGINVRLIATLR